MAFETLGHVRRYINSQIAQEEDENRRQALRVGWYSLYFGISHVAIHHNQTEPGKRGKPVPTFVGFCGLLEQFVAGNLSDQELVMISLAHASIVSSKLNVLVDTIEAPLTQEVSKVLKKLARQLYNECAKDMHPQ